MPVSKTMPALLDALAAAQPDAAAVIDSDIEFSYARLHRDVREAARGLLRAGVRHGDKVAVLMGNCVEWLTASLAAQYVGAVTVAVNTWATPRELAHALGHSGSSILVAAPRYLRHDYREMLADLQAHGQLGASLRHIFWLDESLPPGQRLRELAEAGLQADAVALESASRAVRGEDAAYIVYSSGSTSAPKGIVLAHEPLLVNGWHIGECQHATSADRLWLAVSLFWSFGCVNAVPNALTHGACLVLQHHFDAAEALRLIERHRCTLFYGTPNMAHALAQHPERAARDLRSLRSGATLGTPQQIQRVVDLGAHEICNIYGLTETYGNCTLTDATEPLADRLRFVGRALPGNMLRIADPRDGRALPAGEVGEIRVLGRVLMRYHDDPALTQQSFDEQGYFRTGDLGLLDASGRLQFRGRLKEMVKSGGINVAPVEVEEALMRYESVEAAYVVGVPDEVNDEVLGAVVVPREGMLPDIEVLKALCRAELAAYKVPKLWRIAQPAELPVTTTGKIQKNRLAELLRPAAGEAVAKHRTSNMG